MLSGKQEATLADHDSSIAWHRARVKIMAEDLADYESGHRAERKLVKGKLVDETSSVIAQLKKKIAEHEGLIAAYEKQNAPRT